MASALLLLLVVLLLLLLLLSRSDMAFFICGSCFVGRSAGQAQLRDLHCVPANVVLLLPHRCIAAEQV